MISIIRFTLITAIRDLLFIGLLAVILTAMFISCFLGSTALVEQDQMTLAYMAGSTRLILVVGLVLFVCFHVRRSFDNKEIEVILTKPISKNLFVISYWLAFALLSVIITVPIVVIVAALKIANFNGLTFWGISLILEGIMIVAFAMLSALIMKSAVASALSTLSFYFLSRMMGFFVATVSNFPTSFSLASLPKWGSESILKLVSTILPRLDLFGKTSWLVHGISNAGEINIFLLQSLVYIPLLLAIIIFDFKRKQF
ncbi:MAG: hypothetical protein ACK4OM_01080 [Alphaproteobacteria bacterium]